MGEEVRGLRSLNRWLQKTHRDVKYRTGNGAARERLHMTHGREQCWGDCIGGMLGGGEQRRKSWDN